MLNYFEEYLSLGWKIIPIFPKSKVPIGKNWNLNYNSAKARAIVEENPNCNLGLLLGDIVDVEGDTPEANAFIDELTKHVPHPKFKSLKSVHHLFLNTDPDLTAKRFEGIELRGHRHQSILPPSTHKSGSRYEWINNEIIVPPVPKSLFDLYSEIHPIKPKPSLYIKPLCSRCSTQTPIHKKRYATENLAFKALGMQWHCMRCRELDIRPMCKKINRSFA